MTDVKDFSMTSQGVRDLEGPVCPSRVNVGPNERTASTIGGAVIAGLGLLTGGFRGLALAALGGALVYRGTTGHCTAYAAVGMNTTQ